MEALKWCGYIVVALLVLSVGAGVVLAVGALVAIVGGLVLLCCAVWLVAAFIKGLWEELALRD